MEQPRFHAGETRTYQEMRQKPAPRDTFFSMRSEPQNQRPTSVATEFVDTDFDDDEEIISDVDNSPRISLQSSGQPSFTTISSYDEVPTPRSSRSREIHTAQIAKQVQVQGPQGPHLFRSSIEQAQEEDFILSLSPLTPKVAPEISEFLIHAPPVPRRRTSPFRYTRDELQPTGLASWTPEMVAQSMFDAGIEQSVAERFIENDINGAILITLKFEDLRELDIPSFGIRTRVWHQIQALRDSRPASPRPPTPIEDAPSREARKEARKDGGSSRRKQSGSRRSRRRKASDGDVVTPMESVSIIGIEQVIPKPHKCSKGENCSKWRKQQRAIEQFKRANPNIDIKAGGTVMIVGDAGNPETAKAIDPNDPMRPVSDAVPSVVASSDVFGTEGLPPFQYLQEATLRNVQSRDAQDNVRQFLDFQQHGKNEVPPTPPFEVAASAKPPHHGLRRLPRLSIPANPQPPRPTAPARSSTAPPPTQAQESVATPPEFVPYRMNKADPLSPDLETPTNPYRYGTPFSEMDVPVTAIPAGPVARDISQSVPPDMNYHAITTSTPPPRVQSRTSARRPSFPLLPALDENKPVRVAPKAPSPMVSSPPRMSVRSEQPLQAPPRFQYPWSPIERANFEQAIPPQQPMLDVSDASPPPTTGNRGVTFQGPMKKRKQRMLRSEWQDGYFTLRGTRLNMHKDVAQLDRTLEYVDIDDYAIACSSLASTSKLSAALKAVSLTHKREKSDPVASFSFQLIPQDKNTARLRKRDSSIAAQSLTAEGVNGTGKSHHFAVHSRDERIDWMREMMLAKAMKQKGNGFDVSVNGNMI